MMNSVEIGQKYLGGLMGDPLSAPTHCGYFKHEEGEGHTLSREQEGRKVAGRKASYGIFSESKGKSFQPLQAAAAKRTDGMAFSQKKSGPSLSP